MITMQASVQIFKSVFLGVLDYGSFFESSIQEEIKEDIQILQNNALRCCFNIIYHTMLMYKNCIELLRYKALDRG